MAKAIKFNLTLDKQPVRDKDDLLSNFNIDDLLKLFKEGLLSRWLEVRGLSKELTALEKIKSDDSMQIAIELCRIFQSQTSDEKIKSAVYPFEFRLKEEKELRQFEEKQFKKEEIIKAYHTKYNQLLLEIENKAEDYQFLKASINEIQYKYIGLFELNLINFYERFIFDYPLVILAILANTDMRLKIIDNELLSTRLFTDITNSSNRMESFTDRFGKKKPLPLMKTCKSLEERTIITESNVFVPYSENSAFNGETCSVASLIPPFNYIDSKFLALPTHVKTFSGITDGYWKDLEANDRKYLILKMEDGNFIRNVGKNGEELKSVDVNGKFLILEGIDYKSNNATHQLVYMEV